MGSTLEIEFELCISNQARKMRQNITFYLNSADIESQHTNLILQYRV